MWKVVKAEFNGQDVKTLEDAQVRIFDLGITVFAKGKEVFGADYVLRYLEGANAIDVTTLTRPNPAFPLPFHGKDEVSKGYFVLTPETSAERVKKLEICLPAPDAARPKDLQSPPGKEILHLVLSPAQRPR
jgi:hypothetical protein